MSSFEKVILAAFAAHEQIRSVGYISEHARLGSIGMCAEIEILPVYLELHRLFEDHFLIRADVFKVHDLQAVLFMQEAGIRESPVRRRVRRTLDGADKKVCLSVHVPVDEPQLAPAFLSESFPCIVVACDLASVLKPQFSGILDIVLVYLSVEMQGIVIIHCHHHIDTVHLGYGRTHPPCSVQFQIVQPQLPVGDREGNLEFQLGRLQLLGSKGTTRTGISDHSGMIVWTDLPADETYVLSETKAPAGFTIVAPRNISLTGGEVAHVVIQDDTEKLRVNFYKLLSVLGIINFPALLVLLVV